MSYRFPVSEAPDGAAASWAAITRFAYGCYAWTIFGLVLLACGGLAILVRRPPLGRRIVAAGARFLFRIAAMPLTANGLERLPAGRHVLLVNHTSFLDAIVLTALLPPRPGYVFAVRQQFRSQRLLCPLLRSLGTVVLRRPGGGNDHRNVALMISALRQEANLAIFPEGMFAREPGIRAFHDGAFYVAARVRVPLTVAVLRGTRAAMPLGTWTPRRTTITLEIGPTWRSRSLLPEDIAAVRDAAHAAMVALAGEGTAAGSG